MPKQRSEPQRFQIGDYYLDVPHPEHGGIQYACRYDKRTRTTRRRSLGTTDEGAAKIKLAALVATAPQARSGKDAPPSGEVLTLAVLKAYMDGRGASIASEDVASHTVSLFTDYLRQAKQLAAPVSFWTPAQQLAAARWLHKTYDHTAGGIERRFNVLRSAFLDACHVKTRVDAVGNEIEAALIASAPKIVMTRQRIADELKIPQRKPRPPTLSLDQMAAVLDAIRSDHLFRFAMMELCTWARPRAVLDFDPKTQANWNDGSIDLSPVGWVQTKKRRPRQPMSLCFAGWLSRWTQIDDRSRSVAIAAGELPKSDALIVYKRARVRSVKKTFRRIGTELAIEGFSQKSFRHFMTDQAKKLFTLLPREHRSLWLGHVVRDGSRTTDHYESDDPHVIADVALATDCIISLLDERCGRNLFAIETRLNRSELKSIGARLMPKTLAPSGKNGGRDRDRTCDPLHVKVVRLTDFLAKSHKKRA